MRVDLTQEEMNDILNAVDFVRFIYGTEAQRGGNTEYGNRQLKRMVKYENLHSELLLKFYHKEEDDGEHT